MSSCETPYVAPPPLPSHQNQNPNTVKDPLLPRVPPHLIAEIKTLISPLYSSSSKVPQDIILNGRQLYEGKGTCVNCHGWDGTGNGPASLMVQPPPRNFTDCQFQHVRSDGELFWVIKNGSPDTDMAPMIPVPISEEEAWKILAYIRTFCPTWEGIHKKEDQISRGFYQKNEYSFSMNTEWVSLYKEGSNIPREGFKGLRK